MKRRLLWFAAPILGLVALAARPVFAQWVAMPISKNCVVDGQQFTVTTRDAEQFKQFEITIAPHPRDVSPFLNGQLSLITNDKWVASVPISEKREKGTITYSFRVAPDAIPQSSFEISASAYAPATKDGSYFGTAMIGNRKVEQLMGGTMYDLKLKDFAEAKTR